MDLRAGTSGFAYKSWKGSFYPEDLPAASMLASYAGRLPAVEINNTFYRMPRSSMLEGWSHQVPSGFRFALKASRRITHQKRLADVADELRYLYGAVEALGARRGPILFQLPPYLRKDLPRLEAFLGLLPEHHEAALEFRHPSWYDDAVFEALRGHGAALCIAEAGEESDAPVVATSQLGYLRLRRSSYAEKDLERWVRTLNTEGWREAYVFFKHEDAGQGPALAARFLELHAARTPRRAAAARPAGARRGAS